MARAEIKLPTGAVVTVEGSPEEIDQVLKLYAGVSSGKWGRTGKFKVRASNGPGTSGPMTLIRELKQEGFFDGKQALKSVVDKLAEGGNIYGDASVGKALQRLTQTRELGRIREQGIWKYVKR